MKKEGDIVEIGGKKYTLGKKIGGGLEGTVFEFIDQSGKIDASKFVIKIINESRLSRDQKLEINRHLGKLKDISDRNKDLRKRMTLPRGLLSSDIGYVMNKAIDCESLKNYLISPNDADSFVDWYKTKYTLKRRYQLLENMFEALRAIHIGGLIFTDLSPNNLMVKEGQNGIVFIDTDNLRVKSDSYNGVLGTPGYIAPEIYRNDVPEHINGQNIKKGVLSACGKISVDSDIFSAAIIAFEILTLHHPFIGDIIDDGTPEDEERAHRIETDFIFKEGTRNTSTRDLTSKYHELTTAEIRKLFYRTFVDGKDNPNLRPTGDDFLEAFQNAMDLIVECPDCGFTRLYDCGNENRCIGCEKPIGQQIAMSIYSRFEDMTVAEGLNAIKSNPIHDIDNDSLIDSEGNPPTERTLLSKVVLERGVPKKIRLRHFEETTNRLGRYATVTLSHTSDMIQFVRENERFKDAYIVKKSRSKSVNKLAGGKEFNTDYCVVLEKRPHGKGHMTLFCEFNRC